MNDVPSETVKQTVRVERYLDIAHAMIDLSGQVSNRLESSDELPDGATGLTIEFELKATVTDWERSPEDILGDYANQEVNHD